VFRLSGLLEIQIDRKAGDPIALAKEESDETRGVQEF